MKNFMYIRGAKNVLCKNPLLKIILKHSILF